MDTQTTEQKIRREAVRRRLRGERRCDICEALNRSPRWFSKWWAEYRRNPKTDFADQSRAPQTSPQEMPGHVVHTVVSVRKPLEAARTPETRYGFIGSRAIRGHLERLSLEPLPSGPTIQRILAAHELTHPLGAGCGAAYYPWPVAWEGNAIHATAIITRQLYGGAEIENFHTIDLFSYAVQLSQQTDKTSGSTRAHLLKTWANLGLPFLLSFNSNFNYFGAHSGLQMRRQLGCTFLFCGVEPV